MRKNFYLVILSCSLISCYTYQVKKPADPVANEQKGVQRNGEPAAANAAMQLKNGRNESQNMSQQASVPVNVQQKLTPNKNVKIDVDGKSYKVIVDRWESDSLVAHPVHQPKRVLKFHKNQINADKIAEKRFSQPIADIITVAAYTGIGVAIWYLVR
jgi:ribosomal protein L25 (general stress protein Ctc)